MTPDLLAGLLRVNLAAGSAILVVAAIRKPVRLTFGARLAYGLWSLVPMAGAASLLPPRPAALIPLPAVTPPAGVVAAVETQASDWFAITSGEAVAPAHSALPLDPALLTIALWALGALVMIGWMVRRQAQFMADMARGDAGPAVIGFLKPRIVTPSDFNDRFTAREQTVVLAHERVHLARHDARLNALVALARCVLWFNPLVHLAAHLVRIDQELACDAAVVARHPKARKPYAQALLKAQLAARPLPLGCYWPAGTQHPLTERIAMLKRPNPSFARRLAGGTMIGTLSLTAGYAAWAAAPAAEPIITAPAEYVTDTLAAEPVVAAPEPALAPNPEPAPTPRPEPQAAQPTGNTGSVEGVITKFSWQYPTSQFTVRNAAGQDTVISTADNNTMVGYGATPGNVPIGKTVSVNGYAAPDGSGFYADPADIASNGAQLFPTAVAQPGLAQKLATRASLCGTMPNYASDPSPDRTAVQTAVRAWTFDCQAKVTKAESQVKDGSGPGIPSIISNSVKRTGG